MGIPMKISNCHKKPVFPPSEVMKRHGNFYFTCSECYEPCDVIQEDSTTMTLTSRSVINPPIRPKSTCETTHVWNNGAIITSNLVIDNGERLVSLRIQGPQENMLCDIEMGEMEAVSVAHAILSSIAKTDSDMLGRKT